MRELRNLSLSFRVSSKFKQCLTMAAEREHRSRANFLEQLLFNYCEQHGIKPKAQKKKLEAK